MMIALLVWQNEISQDLWDWADGTRPPSSPFRQNLAFGQKLSIFRVHDCSSCFNCIVVDSDYCNPCKIMWRTHIFTGHAQFLHIARSFLLFCCKCYGRVAVVAGLKVRNQAIIRRSKAKFGDYSSHIWFNELTLVLIGIGRRGRIKHRLIRLYR